MRNVNRSLKDIGLGYIYIYIYFNFTGKEKKI